jgi:hypothetical protein
MSAEAYEEHCLSGEALQRRAAMQGCALTASSGENLQHQQIVRAARVEDSGNQTAVSHISRELAEWELVKLTGAW